MTMIDPASFDPAMTADEVWNALNSLPVSFQQFAEQSYLYSRMYGVHTGAVEGAGGDIIINACLRQSTWARLHFVATETESRMGYNLSPRYHYEEFRMWSNNQGRYATDWPGVQTMSVKPKWTVIEDYGPFDISPYLPIDVTVLTPSTQPIIQFSAAVVDNPLDVQVRHATTKRLYTPLYNLPGYPRIESGNWLLPIDTKLSNFDQSAGVVLQHKKYLMVDVAAPPVGIVGTPTPVYPGTHQVIPQLKVPLVLPDGKIRYTFPIYALVSPAFGGSTVNLESGETWKLLQNFDILALSNETAPAELVWTVMEKDDDDVYQQVVKKVNVTLVADGQQHGAYVVMYKDEPVTYPHLVWEDTFSDCPPMPGLPLLRLWYYTHPARLPEVQRSQIQALNVAICHRVAAELPVEACGCSVATGYIAENQKRFDQFKLNPHSGFEVRSTKFTDTYGRMRYEDILMNMQRLSPLVIL